MDTQITAQGARNILFVADAAEEFNSSKSITALFWTLAGIAGGSIAAVGGCIAMMLNN